MSIEEKQGFPTYQDSDSIEYPHDEKEVSSIIANLQNGKASDFPIRVIKHLSPALSPILCIQYNQQFK